ncbi:MAG TPA: DUF3592 domain-containing protein [Telluria sp.]|jgi:hypothetical protein
MINIILFGLVGTVLIVAGIFLLLRSRATSDWRLVTGTIVEVAIETRRGSAGNSYNTVSYFPVLHYKYIFNGVIRRGSRRLVGESTSRANAVMNGREYLPGNPINVFVEERHPYRHALERGVNHQYWWLVGFGACWIGVAASLV